MRVCVSSKNEASAISIDGLLADPHPVPSLLLDCLEVVVVLGPGGASELAVLLLGPTDVLGPVAGIVDVWIGQAVELAERRVPARTVETYCAGTMSVKFQIILSNGSLQCQNATKSVVLTPRYCPG